MQSHRVSSIFKNIFKTLILALFTLNTSAQEPEAQGDIPLSVSINALMVTLIDHSAHYIWDYAYQLNSRDLTDDEWKLIEYYSVQLAAAGPLITLGGTGPLDKQWVTDTAWRGWSARLADVGASALQAARDQDRQGLIDANNNLVDVCEGCHDVFKPDVPTEGIMHDPEYDHLYHLLSPGIN